MCNQVFRHSDIPLLKWQLLTNETKYFKELENVEWWILLLSSLMVVRTRVSEECRIIMRYFVQHALNRIYDN
jgi:hypothetical protein